MKKNEDRLRHLCGDIKHTKILIIVIPKEEERGGKLIIAENFLNLAKETDIHVWEAQRALNKMNTGRSVPRHIII